MKMSMRAKHLLIVLLLSSVSVAANSQCFILNPENFKHYTDYFNATDEELYPQYYPDSLAWPFLKANIPFFECPDKSLEETYYFRWWTYRKHIKKTSGGFIITEFLPAVSWAGKHNSINCALGHHFYEGRWLHDPEYLDDYMRFWLKDAGGGLRNYSSWIADAWLAFLSVHPRSEGKAGVLTGLIANFHQWEQTHQTSDQGLFWQTDGADGMEVSAGGEISNGGVLTHSYKGIRPTLNSYLYGDAKAIAVLAARAGNKKATDEFEKKATAIKAGVQRLLWSDSLEFFGSIPFKDGQKSASILPVRELIGLVPWYFNLPDDKPVYTGAWKQLMDHDGFNAPYGPTTCEQRNKYFQIRYDGHECQWNGPSWPYATSQVLTAMANVLNNYSHPPVTRMDYYALVDTYSRSQRRTGPDGRIRCWIDENLNPYTGDWISRTRLQHWPGSPWPKDKGGTERGKDYNHSSFCDLIISGLIGITPQLGDTLSIRPLIPPNVWDYFCLDGVLYHGKTITVLYDKYGNRYHHGKGFFIFVNGRMAYHSPFVRSASIRLI